MASRKKSTDRTLSPQPAAEGMGPLPESSWRPLTPRAPLAERGKFVNAGVLGIVLVLDWQPQVWRWTGSGLVLLYDQPFDAEHVTNFFGCYDAARQQLVLFGTEKAPYTWKLAALHMVEQPSGAARVVPLPAELTELTDVNRAFAMWNPAQNEILLLLGNHKGTFVTRVADNRLEVISTPDQIPIEKQNRVVVNAAWDPVRECILADTMKAMCAFDGERWSHLASMERRSSPAGQMAWHPDLEALVSVLSCGALAAWDWSLNGWTTVTPRIEWDESRNSHALAVDDASGRIIVFGGQDFTNAGGDLTNEVLVSEGGSNFRTTFPAAALRLGVTSAHALDDGTLVVINHDAGRADRFEGDHWTPFNFAPQIPGAPEGNLAFHRDSYIAPALEGIWVIDLDGALHFVAWGAAPHRVTEPSGPGWRDGATMLWETARRRLVVIGGDRRNDTWIFDNHWRMLDGARPPRGMGVGCGTAHGIFFAVKQQLWRLDGEDWACVATGLPQRLCSLIYDARRDCLLGVVGQSAGRAAGPVVALERQGTRELIDAPPPQLDWHESVIVGLDGVRDQLLVVARTGVWSLPMGDLPLSSGDIPLEPVRKSRRRRAPKRPPRKLLRRAAAIHREGPPVAAADLPDAPPGYELIAVLPAEKSVLPLKKASGLAVYYNSEAPSGFKLGGDATLVRLLPCGTEAPPLVSDAFKGGVVPFSLELFDELDPRYEEEYDSLPVPPGSGEKVGGFPDTLSGEPLKGSCPVCGSPLRFAAQLGPDAYGFGDGGSLFVFVCPKECWGGGEMQSH